MVDTVTDTRTADSAVSEIENRQSSVSEKECINNLYIQRLTFIDEQILMNIIMIV